VDFLKSSLTICFSFRAFLTDVNVYLSFNFVALLAVDKCAVNERFYELLKGTDIDDLERP